MSRTFGNYILQERIGVGGMGEVYRATKSGPDGFEACVALKLILPHLAREASFRSLFSREARLSALLKHPNIVNVSGFDILDGSPFIEMEYIEGSDLASLLKHIGNGEQLPVEEAVYIIYHAARGLAHAHSFGGRSDGNTGIVHRDFNPHNLLISVEGEVKITDFGIARAARSGIAGSGTLMGKLAYMSPEQVEGRRVDHRSDLFSLGVTAYQLLTGRHPFQRASEAGTLKAVQEASCRPLAGGNASLPPSIAAIVDSLLSALPEARPDSARCVMEVFEEHLKPASAGNLGRRVRDMANAANQISGNSLTAPTLPARPAKKRAWTAVLAILAVVVLLAVWKAGDFSSEAGNPLPGNEPVDTVPMKPASPSTVRMAPDPVSVPVTTEPSGAMVSEGNLILGHTPLSVTIPAGAESRELEITMERYEPARAVLTRDEGEKGVLLTLTPLATGTVRIGAIPWARVAYMGKDMGVTPVLMRDMRTGVQTLVLYNDKMKIRREVTVTVGKGVNPAIVVDMATGKAVQGK